MKSFRNCIVLVSIIAGVLGANAQTTLQGRFTLTSETHWNKAVLPAGEYTFTMESVQSPIVIQPVHGKQSAMVLAREVTDAAPGGSYILITADGSVRSMNLPQVGLSLIFKPLTSLERETLYASAAKTAPITLAMK